jgi:hypothetical protein
MADEKITSDEVTGPYHTWGIDFVNSDRNPAHGYCRWFRNGEAGVFSWLSQELATTRRARTDDVTQRAAVAYPSGVGRRGRMEHPEWCSAW